MGRSASSWDERDVRVRPNRRGTRPRTKDRPKHEDAVVGRVTAVDRGRWTTLVPAGDGLPERVVIAMRARELGRSPVVVGDRVAMVGDTSGRPDGLARMGAWAPRFKSIQGRRYDYDGSEFYWQYRVAERMGIPIPFAPSGFDASG